jgi:hypothetical protein
MLIETRFRSLAPKYNVEDPEFSMSWDEELEEAFRKTMVPPDAPLTPVPQPIIEFVEYIAVMYLTRIRMHSRLDKMRERTAVALTPRGVAESDHRELVHQVPSNGAYAEFQKAQRNARARAPSRHMIPPTRTLPGV